MVAPQVFPDMSWLLLPYPSRRDTLWVVHQQVHVIGFAVELAQLGMSVQMSVMSCWQVVSTGSVKTGRRYLGHQVGV